MIKEVGLIIIIISILSIIKNYRNNILILLSIELLYIGFAFLFISSSLFLDDIQGIITSILLLTLSAIESAIGLSLLLHSRS